MCLASPLHGLLSGCSQPTGGPCRWRGNRLRPMKGIPVRRRAATFKRRYIIIAVVTALVVVGGGGAWAVTHSSSSSAAAPTLVSATSSTIRDSVSASGTIQPAERADLSFAVSGTVTSLPVAAGDQVKVGAILATVRSEERRVGKECRSRWS